LVTLLFVSAVLAENAFLIGSKKIDTQRTVVGEDISVVVEIFNVGDR
jgi:hypothetical protein